MGGLGWVVCNCEDSVYYFTFDSCVEHLSNVYF